MSSENKDAGAGPERICENCGYPATHWAHYIESETQAYFCSECTRISVRDRMFLAAPVPLFPRTPATKP